MIALSLNESFSAVQAARVWWAGLGCARGDGSRRSSALTFAFHWLWTGNYGKWERTLGRGPFSTGWVEPLWQRSCPQVCGSPDIPLHLLKSVATYKGVEPTSALIQWFWEVMESFSNTERSLFLRFVWGRTRLPRTIADFRGRDFVVQVRYFKREELVTKPLIRNKTFKFDKLF